MSEAFTQKTGALHALCIERAMNSIHIIPPTKLSFYDESRQVDETLFATLNVLLMVSKLPARG